MYFLYIIKSQHYFSNRVVIDVDSCTVSKRNPKAWLPDFQLFESDRDCILSPTGWLTDTIINAVQIMLKKQFPHINGLQDTCLGSVYQFNSLQGEFIQILFSPGHWLTISTMGLTHPCVAVFDSKYSTVSTPVASQIASILRTSHQHIELQFMDIQQQVLQRDVFITTKALQVLGMFVVTMLFDL